MSEQQASLKTDNSTRKSSGKNFQRGKVVTIDRSQVVPDDYNPRYISEANAERLKKSIKDNGLVGHLVWNKTTGHIVGGHQRLEALDSLMRTDDYPLEVLMVELPLKEEVKLNVVLNNTDNQGEFDFSALSELATQFNLDVATDFGFSEEVIDIQFPAIAEIGAVGEEGEPAPEKVASPEEIARMKELKKEVREKLKADRAETGDYNTEAKGILTIVFDRESAKKQWMIDHGADADNIPNVMHIFDFEKLLSGESSNNVVQDIPEETSEEQ